MGLVFAGITALTVQVTEYSRAATGMAGAVLVDPSGDCWGQETAWRTLPWGSFTRLDRFDATDVAFAGGGALARAIGLELTTDSSHSTK